MATNSILDASRFTLFITDYLPKKAAVELGTVRMLNEGPSKSAKAVLEGELVLDYFRLVRVLEEVPPGAPMEYVRIIKDKVEKYLIEHPHILKQTGRTKFNMHGPDPILPSTFDLPTSLSPSNSEN